MTQLTIPHLPSLFTVGEIFKGEAEDRSTGHWHNLTAVVVETADQGHRGSLLLLPVGGRFDANRTFMPAWRPVDATGDWEVQKWGPSALKPSFVTLVPDFASARSIALDERQYGDHQKVRLFKHGPLTAEEAAGLADLDVEATA